ncbi:MAG: pyrimidine dimer DNA glycosylase/endonuclease V [Anaerolineales bacterium]
MRLWSLSPVYLDRMGLLGLWREGLLAQSVIAGKTEGYRHHPQLIRFKSQEDPLTAIGHYLSHVANEADRRGYQFNRKKILSHQPWKVIPVSTGQLKYEYSHLMQKLQDRDKDRYQTLKAVKAPKPHPSFVIVPGDTAAWEKI